jgi:hypothetical protein
VQETEQQVILAQALEIRLDGFLDLDDQLGFVEQRISAGQDRDANIAERLIGVATFFARAGFDEDFVSSTHQFHTGRGNKSDPPLAGFQLTGNSNTHGVCVLLCGPDRVARLPAIL